MDVEPQRRRSVVRYVPFVGLCGSNRCCVDGREPVMTDTGTQTGETAGVGFSSGEDGVACQHQCCTTDQCMRIPEAGYACLPGGSHACCGACYKHQFWMPDGGYSSCIPIPHDAECDRENPESASWEPRRRKTEEVYLRKKEVERETREVFHELCDHPWGFSGEFLAELGAPARTPAETSLLFGSASGSNPRPPDALSK